MLPIQSLTEVQIQPCTQSTLAFLVKEGSILLANKKRGFGAGKWNGIGGKQDAGETIEQTMIRESGEEIGVVPTSYERMAILNFAFWARPEWDQQVHVYVVRHWDGEPVETEEMAPQWYELDAIPYPNMWSDDPLWLPRVLAGQKLHAQISFNERAEVVGHELAELP